MKRLMILLLSLALLLPAAGLSDPSPEAAPEKGESVPLETGTPEEGESVPMADEDDEPEAGEEDLPEEEDLEEETVDARVLQYGDEGDDVLELQVRLKDLKYYTGNLSGRYREGTREAIRAFQKDFDLEQTGVADLKTQSLLFAAVYRPLRVGAQGDAVKELQTRLMELGYYKGKISGNYLSGTQSAVRRFQENAGLPVTGAADPATQQALYAPGAAVPGTSPDSTSTPVPDLNGRLHYAVVPTTIYVRYVPISGYDPETADLACVLYMFVNFCLRTDKNDFSNPFFDCAFSSIICSVIHCFGKKNCFALKLCFFFDSVNKCHFFISFIYKILTFISTLLLYIHYFLYSIVNALKVWIL